MATSKPALILLHGWGMDRQVWAEFAPLLAADFAVSLAEIPGFGAAGAVATLDQAVEQLASAYPQPAIWLGWSLGGQLALQLANRYPQQVRGLVCLAATPCFVQQNDWPLALPAATFSDFTQQLEQQPLATLARFYQLQCTGEPAQKACRRYLRQHLPDTPPPGLASGLSWLQHDGRAALSQMSMPVQHLLGANDPLVPVALAQWLAQTLPQQRCQVIAAAGHLPFFSQPQAVLAALRTFAHSL